MNGESNQGDLDILDGTDPMRQALPAFGSWCAAKMVCYIIKSDPKINGGIDKVMMEEQTEDNDWT